jgi:hypothetical protein
MRQMTNCVVLNDFFFLLLKKEEGQRDNKKTLKNPD